MTHQASKNLGIATEATSRECREVKARTLPEFVIGSMTTIFFFVFASTTTKNYIIFLPLPPNDLFVGIYVWWQSYLLILFNSWNGLANYILLYNLPELPSVNRITKDDSFADK